MAGAVKSRLSDLKSHDSVIAPGYLNPDIPAKTARVSIPLIDATTDHSTDMDVIVDDPNDVDFDIVRWPSQGWRPVDPDSGDEGGNAEGVFTAEWKGDGIAQILRNTDQGCPAEEVTVGRQTAAECMCIRNRFMTVFDEVLALLWQIVITAETGSARSSKGPANTIPDSNLIAVYIADGSASLNDAARDIMSKDRCCRNIVRSLHPMQIASAHSAAIHFDQCFFFTQLGQIKLLQL